MITANLYTSGDGLYGTHVTWADIEGDMQRELNTNATFGLSKSAKDVGGGNGLMSKTLLIEPDWLDEEKVLPKQFVVKIITQLILQAFSANSGDSDSNSNNQKFMADLEALQKRVCDSCHNSEVIAYSSLSKISDGSIPIPKIYYTKKFSVDNPVKGYIIMEFVENTRAVHVFENVTPSEVKQILCYKAVVEACSLTIPQEERHEFSTTPFQDIFAFVFRKELLESNMSMFRAFANERLSSRVKQLEHIIPDISDVSWADRLTDELGMDRVFCHGDLWSMNILWRSNGDELKLAAVLDYQNSHFGCAAIDLVRVLSSCLSAKDRREHWEELLEYFYEHLKEKVAERKMPYTLAQLKESYQRLFPIVTFLMAPMIGPLYEMNSKNMDNEHKKKCLDIAIEKTEGLLDDMFYYHDQNTAIQNDRKLS